jgi:hypothetical protein
VFGINERGDASVALRLGHDMERKAGLPRTFRSIDLDDPPPRSTATSSAGWRAGIKSRDVEKFGRSRSTSCA